MTKNTVIFLLYKMIIGCLNLCHGVRDNYGLIQNVIFDMYAVDVPHWQCPFNIMVHDSNIDH